VRLQHRAGETIDLRKKRAPLIKEKPQNRAQNVDQPKTICDRNSAIKQFPGLKPAKRSYEKMQPVFSLRFSSAAESKVLQSAADFRIIRPRRYDARMRSGEPHVRRRPGGGLAATLAGLGIPTPVSTELGDDDFDPTGGALGRRDEDLDDSDSDADADAGAPPFGESDDDEGVRRPTKGDAAIAAGKGKGKLRMRVGIALDDGEYVGKSSSRKAMEGVWAGEEEEEEEDMSDEEDEDEGISGDDEDVSVDDDDELSEEEGVSGDDEEVSVDDDDELSEDDPYADEDEDYAYPMTSPAPVDEDLEEQLAAVRAEEAETNRLLVTKSQNCAKGVAVRTQNASWERSLRTRIVLQKSLNLAAKMPTPSYLQSLKQLDPDVAPALAKAAAAARQTLDALLRLQASLMECNPAIAHANELDGTLGKRKSRGVFAEASRLDLIGKPHDLVWSLTDKMYKEFANFKDQSCDRWHRKAQVSSGKVGDVTGSQKNGNNSLTAFDQSLSRQVRSAMRLPDRLVKRSRPPAHLAPRRLGEPLVGGGGGGSSNPDDPEEKHAEKLLGDSLEDGGRVAEVYEDADFYEQALKQFLETRGGFGSGAGSNRGPSFGVNSVKPTNPKRRKQVDRRASKGRKLRYHVQTPLVNFCAPVDLEVPGWAEKVFTRLFAST
jgi:protein AATF/BFR2